MSISIQPTFTAKRFGERQDYVTLICRETGDRYSFTETHPHDRVPIFRNGEVMAYRRGRAPILHCIESDARWAIREDMRAERASVRRHRELDPSHRGVWL